MEMTNSHFSHLHGVVLFVALSASALTVVVAWAWRLMVVTAMSTMVGSCYKCFTGTTAMCWRGAMLGREVAMAVMLVVGTWRVTLYMLLRMLLRDVAVTLVGWWGRTRSLVADV